MILETEDPPQKTSKAWDYQRQPDGKDEWITPEPIIRALGRFDLDPCSPISRPWPTAEHHLTVLDNGLMRDWSGRVFCNPPYKTAAQWLRKCAGHGNAIAMVFARTETKMFFDCVWNSADAVLFIKGRVTFLHVDGSRPKFTSGGPSCLIAYGAHNVTALENSKIDGKLIRLK